VLKNIRNLLTSVNSVGWGADKNLLNLDIILFCK
jgi:hypothetical protein